ncbi:MAG: PH domain-containing protein [Propionibacteriales bacterium]|nr:PH domain-containing protein [Propionibacteriales bacterium]
MNTHPAVSLPPLPWRYRPLGARLMVLLMSVMLLAAVLFMWFAMPGEIRAEFNWAQRVTLLGILLVMLVGLFGIARSSVSADDSGLRIVNVYRVWRLEWAQVLGVHLGPGEPWAVLDVDDGTTVMAMAIQGADGRRARRATEQLVGLVDAHSRTSRND